MNVFDKILKNKVWQAALIALIILLGLYYIPLPYYISQPGEAVELEPIIDVENGQEEQGTFMLTTVRMGEANAIGYAFAKMNEYMELIDKDSILSQFEDEDDYSRYQLQAMESSQESAILVAYELAGKKVEVHDQGVLVSQTVPGMPAREQLEIGDLITHVDGKPLSTSEALIDYIHAKQAGDTVTLKYIRNDEEYETTLRLAHFPQSLAEEENNIPPRAGLGIATLTQRDIKVDPPVNINTERIGGPSAGLMFALEIYNQLTEGDLTKGYRIAGTGTIDAEGNVGRIGGIHQKVIAAERAETDIFFAPHEQGKEHSNYDRAKETALDIGSDMEIVPVETIHDALDYLERLPEKSGS